MLRVYVADHRAVPVRRIQAATTAAVTTNFVTSLLERRSSLITRRG